VNGAWGRRPGGSPRRKAVRWSGGHKEARPDLTLASPSSPRLGNQMRHLCIIPALVLAACEWLNVNRRALSTVRRDMAPGRGEACMQ
jgi:hypothetical protein